MNVQCAWCGAPISGKIEEGAPISHGMCATCEEMMQFSTAPVAEFVESLPGPVMLVDSDGRALGVNSTFAEFLKKDGSTLVGSLGGDVISCIYSALPGGCGKTEHCVGCTIRNALNQARATGEAQVSMPAFAVTKGADGPVRMAYRISLERVGREAVLLRIDSASPDTEPVERPATVLVVDDDSGVRRFLARVLTAAGYRVLQSSDGRDAVRVAASEIVDVVVTDLVMPEQEGIETVMQLRRARTDLAIIAISGAFNGQMLHAARHLGADLSLQKPVTPVALLEAVKKARALRGGTV